MVELYKDAKIDAVAAVESRGFLFAAPFAQRLGIQLRVNGIVLVSPASNLMFVKLSLYKLLPDWYQSLFSSELNFNSAGT